MTYRPRHTWAFVHMDADSVDLLRPVLAETNRDVEFWTGICKQLGREIDHFCKEEMRAAKRLLKAAEWLKKYWDGDVTLKTLASELENDVDRLAWRVINASSVPLAT